MRIEQRGRADKSHPGVASCWEQKDRLAAADSLQILVTALEDSIARLQEGNAQAYHTGYQTAYANYQGLSRHYVDELRKPRISLGSTLPFVAAAELGIIAGRALR